MPTAQAIEAAVEAFDRDGFAVIRGFFDQSETGELVENFERFVREVAPKLGANRVYYEDKSDPRTIFRIDKLDEDSYFDGLMRGDALAGLARSLLRDELIMRGMQMFGKAPKIGNVTPPHQDAYYWKINPPQGLTMWIPIDKVDLGNGTIRYVPGSHKKGFRNHELGDVFGFSLGITDFGSADEAVEVPIVAEAGDLIVHHGVTIHRADRNPSERLRRAIGPVYFAKSVAYDVEAAEAHKKRVHEKWAESKRL